MSSFLCHTHSQDQPHPPQQEKGERLYLEEAELEWAWEIHQAIRENNSTMSSSTSDEAYIRPITDYEIAQLAIVTLGQEDLTSVLERVFQLQCLREEYGIVDTPEEGVELLRAIQEQQPGHILALDKICTPHTEYYMGVFDFAANRPSAVDLPNDWRIYLGAYYYLLSASCCNLQTTREGFVTICECDGMGYNTFSHKMQQRWAQELGMHYPLQQKESLWLNTPMVANVMCAFIKPWMNARKSRWDKIKLGCKMDWFDGRINDLINVPTPEAAQAKLLHNVYTALVERYHNCKTYVLPVLTVEEDNGEDNNNNNNN